MGGDRDRPDVEVFVNHYYTALTWKMQYADTNPAAGGCLSSQ